jgi:cbb3-type cytochrome oxidase maturation protein
MESLFVLIPLAILFCAAALVAYFWAINHHQFDDLDSAAHSILFDEDHRSDIDPNNRADQQS